MKSSAGARQKIQTLFHYFYILTWPSAISYIQKKQKKKNYTINAQFLKIVLKSLSILESDIINAGDFQDQSVSLLNWSFLFATAKWIAKRESSFPVSHKVGNVVNFVLDFKCK